MFLRVFIGCNKMRMRFVLRAIYKEIGIEDQLAFPPPKLFLVLVVSRYFEVDRYGILSQRPNISQIR